MDIQEQNISARFLSPAEAAQLLGVSLRTILRWIRAGDIPHLRRGSTIRLSWPEVVQALRVDREESPR